MTRISSIVPYSSDRHTGHARTRRSLNTQANENGAMPLPNITLLLSKQEMQSARITSLEVSYRGGSGPEKIVLSLSPDQAKQLWDLLHGRKFGALSKAAPSGATANSGLASRKASRHRLTSLRLRLAITRLASAQRQSSACLASTQANYSSSLKRLAALKTTYGRRLTRLPQQKWS